MINSIFGIYFVNLVNEQGQGPTKKLVIKELELYIINNKHLPNVPSEKELSNKENSINVAEMLNIQMEKIEESYLYILELNKKIEVLQKENQELKTLIIKK